MLKHVTYDTYYNENLEHLQIHHQFNIELDYTSNCLCLSQYSPYVIMPAFAASLAGSEKSVRQHTHVKFVVMPPQKHKVALQLLRGI